MQECYKGPKYGFQVDEDVFTLIIKNPEVNDSGRYSCVVRECNDLTCKAYLDVTRKDFTAIDLSALHCILRCIPAPDPSYGFDKKLDKKKGAKRKRKVKLRCKTDDPKAKVKWYKDGKEIKNSDTRFLIKSDEQGEQSLEIKEADLQDSGVYTCKIEEFGKEGENETSCELTIGGIKKEGLFA